MRAQFGAQRLQAAGRGGKGLTFRESRKGARLCAAPAPEMNPRTEGFLSTSYQTAGHGTLKLIGKPEFSALKSPLKETHRQVRTQADRKAVYIGILRRQSLRKRPAWLPVVY